MSQDFKNAFVRSLALALILFATLFAYLPGLNGPFLFDDNIHIVQNPQVQITDLSFDSLAQAWNSSLACRLTARYLVSIRYRRGISITGRFVSEKLVQRRMFVPALGEPGN